MADDKAQIERPFDEFVAQLNLMDLALFDQVARQGNMSRAAEKLGEMTESTASRRLRRLETLLGSRLFDRTARQMKLTDAGESYLHQVEEVLSAIHELHQLTGVMHSQPASTLKIGGGMFIAEILHRDFLGRFINAHPEITVLAELINLNELDAVIRDLDIIVIEKLPTSQNVGLRKLAQYKTYFWASRQYLKTHGRPGHPRELTQHRFLALRDVAVLWGTNHLCWEEADGTRRWEPINSPFYCDSASFLIDLAKQGEGVLLAPLPLVQDAGDAFEVLFDGQYGTTLDLYAIFPSARLMPSKVALFLNELDAYLKQQPLTL